MSFTSFNLHPTIMSGVTKAGYQNPTPIQQQSIPVVMRGGDVMGLAQTGTGKTAAFALPILHRLVSSNARMITPRALVIAPTRELAEQINQSFITLASQTRLRTVTVYGGVNINPQIDRLRRGVDVVVACPGRLLDHINQRTIDLSSLEVLVLDEADQMFDMGFFPDIRRILKQLPTRRQTLLFSATMPPEIGKLAAEVLTNPQTVQIDRVAPAATVTHAIYPVEQHRKTALLLGLLEHTDTESVLVFTRTKHRAKRLDQQLSKAGYRAASLQGNLSQNRRQEALDGFRSGKYQILVATDIAARGIDVSQVSHVINYDIPDTVEAYIHRIGRTGRAARTGDAFTLTTGEDAAMIKAIERKLEAPLPRRRLDGFDYNVPAPAKDTEFARPPREPRPRKKVESTPSAAKSSGTPTRPANRPAGAKGASPKPAGAQPAASPSRSSRPAQANPEKPAGDAAKPRRRRSRRPGGPRKAAGTPANS